LLSPLGFSAGSITPKAVSQEAGWVTLFDGKIENGNIVVDKMAGKEAGYLVTTKPYKNFIVRVEFWSSDDANSGIYFRCLDPKKITARTRAMAPALSHVTSK